MRSSLLALAFLVLLVSPAAAQLVGNDTAPGDSCADKPAGATRMVADPDGNGSDVTLICDGSTWNTAGVKVYDDSAACDASKDGTIRYISTGDPPWEYCDGGASSWVNFKQPRCQDDDTGECYLQATRSNDDPEFLAGNIKENVNILGVTGNYAGSAATPCSDDDTAECLLDATRDNSDPEFLAANIRDGYAILGITGTYVSNVGAGSGGLDPLNFNTVFNAGPGETYTSNTVTISGLQYENASLSFSGTGAVSIIRDGIDMGTTGPVTIVEGTEIALKATASSSYNTARNFTVDVGGSAYTTDWAINTGAQCNSPGSTTFSYTGSIQTFDVDSLNVDCTFRIRVYGAGEQSNAYGGGVRFEWRAPRKIALILARRYARRDDAALGI